MKFETETQQQQFDFYFSLGNKIRKSRKEAGFTQEDLAFMMNISRVSVNNIEMGKQRLPVHLISSIAELFKISIHELIPNYNHNIKSCQELFEHKKKAAIEKFDEKYGDL